MIETINAIPSLEKESSDAERRRAIDAEATRRDKAIRDEGIYILISKREHLISRVLVRERLDSVLSTDKRAAIRNALVEGFKEKDFDGGLTRAVDTIEQSLPKVPVVSHRANAPAALPRKAEAGQSTMGTFLMILLAIVAVLVVLRVLGGLLSRGRSSGYPGQMGGMGMQRPGMGAGQGYYGGGGYGGGGGGFFSSLMGGIGGAVAGNWLYDQFSGRHGSNIHSSEAYSPDPGAGVPDQGGDAIIGADDNPGGSASWDDGGGGNDAGGGDWGGGGGGDWGGGGGDWGGGGDGGGGGDW